MAEFAGRREAPDRNDMQKALMISGVGVVAGELTTYAEQLSS